MDSKPTCRKYSDGSKAWYLNGKLHREDGPAVEYSNGTKHWYLNGKLVSPKDLVEQGYMTEAEMMLYLL